MSLRVADPAKSTSKSQTGAAGDVARLMLPTGQEWPLSEATLTIGRRVGNHIRLDDPRVAPEHAEIVRLPGEIRLVDLSGGATIVNGERVHYWHVLQDGDLIQVADQVFQFHDPGDDSSAREADPTDGSAEYGVLLFQELPLGRGEISIGRAPGNDLVVDDPRVGDVHATVTRRGGDYYLIDLGSRNGTYVNEQRIRRVHRLQDGDLLVVGSTPITFLRRGLRIDRSVAEHDTSSYFVFADLTGRRWQRVRFGAVLGSLVLGVFALLFAWLILQ